MRYLLVGAMLCLSGAAVAQTNFDLRFDEAFANKSLRVYQCPGASSDFGASKRNLPLLLSATKKLAAGGDAAEIATAKSAGCTPIKYGKPGLLSWEEKLSGPEKGATSEWLTAVVTESAPGATGYTFDAVIRLPLSTRLPTPQAAAARADADFMKTYGERILSGGNEQGGYFLCPSIEAANMALASLAEFPESERDDQADFRTEQVGCKSGQAPVYNVRAFRRIGVTQTHWYVGTGTLRGKPVSLLFWAN